MLTRGKLLLILLNYHSNSHQWPLITGLPAQRNQSNDSESFFLSTVSYTWTEHSKQATLPLCLGWELVSNCGKGLPLLNLRWFEVHGSEAVWCLLWRHRTMLHKEKRTCVHQRQEPPSCREHGASHPASSYGHQSVGRGTRELLLGGMLHCLSHSWVYMQTEENDCPERLNCQVDKGNKSSRQHTPPSSLFPACVRESSTQQTLQLNAAGNTDSLWQQSKCSEKSCRREIPLPSCFSKGVSAKGTLFIRYLVVKISQGFWAASKPPWKEGVCWHP